MVIQKARRFCLKSENIGQRKMNWKSHFFFESQQYIYHHETEEEYRGSSFLLAVLLNPLTENEFIIRDLFDAANKIKSIPPDVFDDGYIFASFDVESLFTNMPLQRTISIILDRFYNNKIIVKLTSEP